MAKPRPRKWDSKEYHKMVKANGYVYKRNNGDHVVYTNGNRTISVPVNVNKVLGLRLIKEYALDIEAHLRRSKKCIS